MEDKGAMTYYAQYGEENVIDSFFKKKIGGVCVDVGAADGLRYSNSRYLIESLGWSALLVEPHPTYYSRLLELYHANKNISLMNCAVYSSPGSMPFHLYGHDEHAQVSTLSENFKERVCLIHGDKYENQPIDFNVVTLDTVLDLAIKNKDNIDFLSIDCEGVDMDVLISNNWEKHRPSLVCVEHSIPKQELDTFMSLVDYSLFYRTAGNSFFTANKENK